MNIIGLFSVVVATYFLTSLAGVNNWFGLAVIIGGSLYATYILVDFAQMSFQSKKNSSNVKIARKWMPN